MTVGSPRGAPQGAPHPLYMKSTGGVLVVEEKLCGQGDLKGAPMVGAPMGAPHMPLKREGGRHAAEGTHHHQGIRGGLVEGGPLMIL